MMKQPSGKQPKKQMLPKHLPSTKPMKPPFLFNLNSSPSKNPKPRRLNKLLESRAKQRAIRVTEGMLVEEGWSVEEIEEMESQAAAKELYRRVEDRD
eukprot:272057-Ditylum_brightwellii.AAC.1